MGELNISTNLLRASFYLGLSVFLVVAGTKNFVCPVSPAMISNMAQEGLLQAGKSRSRTTMSLS